MAGIRCCAIGFALLAIGGIELAAAEPIVLRERVREGATRVTSSLKADGLFIPHSPAGTPEAKAAKPLLLKVETRLDFAERVVPSKAPAQGARAVRWVRQAALAINGEVRPQSQVLRSDVALLVAERRDGKVVVVSPSGPLTRAELDLVQDVADPLTFADLLPRKPVSEGDRWPISNDGAKALSGYEVLAAQSLEATLEKLDDDTAHIKISGEIHGASYGSGEGSVKASCVVLFDRKAELINELRLERSEKRKPGEVEDGLDVKSTLVVERRDTDPPAPLADDALAQVPLEIDAQRLLLVQIGPEGKYTLLHDRDWHVYQETARQTVLKRLDHGEVVAYCNLAAGPNAGKGRHQELRQFRDDIRKALGERFQQFLGEGEVDGDPAGGFRYKVGVQGHQGKLGVLWDYYLVASPEGDQLLITFTMSDASVKAFGDQDTQLIGSLRWQEANEPASKP